MTGGPGADTLKGEGGIDTISYATAAGPLTLNLATRANNQGDTLSGFENAKGTAADDRITGTRTANRIEGLGGNDNLKGGAGDDVLLGGSGNDTISGGGGGDTLNGGPGVDTVSYASQPAVTITLGGANNAGDTVSQMENVNGSRFADTITGNAGANLINGGRGGDTLNGAGGNDTIIGKGGKDTIDGGGPSTNPGDKCRGNTNPVGQQDVLTNCEDSIP
ncbi:MAG: calcium-binding protein [Dehalococcoidia bacterium]